MVDIAPPQTSPDIDPLRSRPDEAGSTGAPRRVTVVAPHTRVDLALPTQATIAEVVHQVVELIGNDQLDPGGSAGGWVLQRLGESPLEPGRPVSSTTISDGDLLQLSPRSKQVPPALFDDIVDAIADASANRPDRWQWQTTRHLCLVLAAALAAVAAAGLLGAEPGITVLASSVAAALLVLAAAGLSRALGDASAGLAAGVAALPHAAWAGTAVATGADAVTDRLGPVLLVGGGAVLLTAVAALVGVGRYLEVFGCIVGVAATAVVAGAVIVLWSASPSAVAAVVVSVVTMTLPALPMLSARLARLPLPFVPVDIEEFRRDDRPIEAAQVASLARHGETMLLWILVTFSAIVVACAGALLLDGSTWARLLALALALTMVLRSRRFLGRGQRLVLLIPGVVGLVGAVATWLATASPGWRLAMVPAGLALATVLVAWARSQPRRRASPYAARFVSVLEFLALVAVLPLAAAVLDLYQRIRAAAS
jgi:type VII secretion integral membrane protein EccD